jgi:hypothetical protein
MDKYIETKEEALERVTFANKEDYCRIFSFAENWVKIQFKHFSADDLKEAYFAGGGSEIKQPNVIGAVFRDLSKGGLIFHHGFTKSKNKVAHGRDLKTWISLEYKMRQQNNASNKNNLKLEL